LRKAGRGRGVDSSSKRSQSVLCWLWHRCRMIEHRTLKYTATASWNAYVFVFRRDGSLVTWGFGTGASEQEALMQAREAPLVVRRP